MMIREVAGAIERSGEAKVFCITPFGDPSLSMCQFFDLGSIQVFCVGFSAGREV